MEDEQCPKCGSLFPAKRAWAHHTFASFLNPFGDDLDTRVRCPNCNHVFDAAAYRFFGFIAPRAMRIGVTVYVVAMLCAILYQFLVP